MTTSDIIRPSRHRVIDWLLESFFDDAATLLRTFAPVISTPLGVIVSRYDDVHEVLERDADFPPPYDPRLALVLDRSPFVLTMRGGSAFNAYDQMMRDMVGANVGPRLAAAVRTAVTRRLAAAKGSIDVVALAREVTVEVLCADFGTPSTPAAPMALWNQRLFEYIFIGDDGGKDIALIAEVNTIAPQMRAYIDGLIAAAKVAPSNATVLGRGLLAQASGGGPTDLEIRTILVGLLVAGVPQIPMAVRNRWRSSCGGRTCWPGPRRRPSRPRRRPTPMPTSCCSS